MTFISCHMQKCTFLEEGKAKCTSQLHSLQRLSWLLDDIIFCFYIICLCSCSWFKPFELETQLLLADSCPVGQWSVSLWIGTKLERKSLLNQHNSQDLMQDWKLYLSVNQINSKSWPMPYLVGNSMLVFIGGVFFPLSGLHKRLRSLCDAEEVNVL